MGPRSSDSVNAAIATAAALGIGEVLLSEDVAVTSPIILRSNVWIRAVGAPKLTLADGANCSVIESDGYSSAAAASWTDLTYAVENCGIRGHVVVDGNRENNAAPAANSGHGIAIFGRNFDIDSAYISNVYRRGLSTYYAASMTNGVSPYNGRIGTITIDQCGEIGWANGVSDLQFGVINIASASQNTNNGFPAILMDRSAAGQAVIVWRKGVNTNTHSYAIRMNGGI